MPNIRFIIMNSIMDHNLSTACDTSSYLHTEQDNQSLPRSVLVLPDMFDPHQEPDPHQEVHQAALMSESRAEGKENSHLNQTKTKKKKSVNRNQDRRHKSLLSCFRETEKYIFLGIKETKQTQRDAQREAQRQMKSLKQKLRSAKKQASSMIRRFQQWADLEKQEYKVKKSAQEKLDRIEKNKREIEDEFFKSIGQIEKRKERVISGLSETYKRHILQLRVQKQECRELMFVEQDKKKQLRSKSKTKKSRNLIRWS